MSFLHTTLLLTASLLPGQAGEVTKPFRINVLDEQTGRGVPLVELRTVNNITYYTDSNGIVAFNEPGLMGKEVFFYVGTHGYLFPADGFGQRGKALRVTPGGSATLRIQRNRNIAERLYRITGGGIYVDSVKVGAKTPLAEPLLNGLVVGCDSVVSAVYRSKLHWFWGDTNRPGHPLGNFKVSGATSELPSKGGLDPDVGINLDYFVDDKGFAKQMMPFETKGTVWMTALVPLKDAKGQERLYASYIKIQPIKKAPGFDVYARGLAIFDDEKKEFRHVAEVPMNSTAFPDGQVLRYREDDTDYLYFGNPFPTTRVKASAAAFLDIEQYETFTCVKDGARPTNPKELASAFDRDTKGDLRYAWRKDTPIVGPREERDFGNAGYIKASEARWLLHDRATKELVEFRSGSVCWNEHRSCYVLIGVQNGGDSMLGEIWYAEAPTPVGPWHYGAKVVTHRLYSFYNPRQHPFFDKDKGRYIFFEGTYTTTFSGNGNPTPRYEYNQIMYKLDVNDERLVLPVPIYRAPAAKVPYSTKVAGKAPVFYALDRPIKGTVPIVADKTGLKVGKADDKDVVFYAPPADSEQFKNGTWPLYEYRKSDDERIYTADPKYARPGYEKQETPLCRVWSR